MRVIATFGSLIIGASLCAARACAPHPRPTTTSSLISEINTTTVGGAATTTTSPGATEAESSIGSSITIETSTAESATTELDSTSSGSETLSVTESEASAESSATSTAGVSSFTTVVASTTAVASEETETSTTVDEATASEAETSVDSSATSIDDISSFTTLVASTTAVTSEESEISTTIDEATTTTVEATMTTAGPPMITNLVQNGDFEDGIIDPWVVQGTTPAVFRSFFCLEGSKCMQLPGDLNYAQVCQRVEVEAGFEYTFKAQVLQNCMKSYGSNNEVCDNNINTAELSIAGVFNSGAKGIVGYNSYNDYTYTFSYTGLSIDSTDLCILILQNQGISPSFYLDGVSFTRGKAVPIPEPTDP